jgi:hypothetical protein
MNRARYAALHRAYSDIVAEPIPNRFLGLLCKLGKLVDQDTRYGTLWRLEATANSEPIVVVEVVDATVGKNGRRKQYFLGVPPFVTSAREAVAWTFDVPPDRYEPQVET